MFKTLLISLLVSLSVNALFYFNTKQIASVDILAMTNQFIQEEVRKNQTAQEKERAIKSFSHRLDASLRQLAQSKSLILLPKEAVIQGSPDYTQTLMTMMKKS